MRRLGKSINKEILIALGAGIAAAVIVALYLRGPAIGLSPDSVSYLAAADHLMEGQGLLNFQGRAMVMWPPLYPSVLALLAVPFGDPVVSAVVLNVLCHGAITALAILWWRRNHVAWPLVGVGSLILAVAPPFVWTGGWLWSEGLLAALLMATMVSLDTQAIEHDWRRLLTAAGLAAAVSLTRYIGIVPALLVPLWALLLLGVVAWRKILIIASVSLLPLGLWLLNNLRLSGTLSGPREPGPGFSLALIGQLVDHLTRPLLPKENQAVGCILLVALMMGGAALFQVFRMGRRAAFDWWFAVANLLGLSAMLIFSVSTVAMDRIGTRLVMPLVPLMLLALVLALDRLRLLLPTAVLRRVGTGGVTVFLALLAIQPLQVTRNTLHQGRQPADWELRAGGLPDLATEFPEVYACNCWYSNDPLTIYMWFRRPTEFVPRDRRHPTASANIAPEEWDAHLRDCGGTGYLLWVGPRNPEFESRLATYADFSWELILESEQLQIHCLRYCSPSNNGF